MQRTMNIICQVHVLAMDLDRSDSSCEFLHLMTPPFPAVMFLKPILLSFCHRFSL